MRKAVTHQGNSKLYEAIQVKTSSRKVISPVIRPAISHIAYGYKNKRHRKYQKIDIMNVF